MKVKHFFFVSLSVITIAGCKDKTATEKSTAKAFDPASLDSTIKPGDDFFEFVNSKWIKANPIPSDKGRYGSFDMLDDLSQKTLKSVMENDSKANGASGSNTQKVGDFWASGMDSASIEKAGIEPLKTYLDAIDASTTADDIIKNIASMHTMFAGAFFNAQVQQDPKNSADQIMNISQGGLGLPDRDYYFRNDDQSKQLRDAYVVHVKNVLTLMGIDDASASASAQSIMKIETALAKASMTNVETRDPYAIYHKMSKEDLTAIAPNINWTMYFDGLKTPAFTDLDVSQPEFFKALSAMMKDEDMATIKIYLKYHLVNSFASYLSSNFEAEDFNFYNKTLQGVDQMETRWKRVVGTANFCIGEALGQEYVKVAFTAESKERMIDLIKNLKSSLSERISKLEWMSDSTKTFAQSKLNTMNVKVGYPDKWRDYSALTIDKGPYVLNVIRSFQFEAQRQLNKIGKPVDKAEWLMVPQQVNAYYDPSNNEIVFPAAILQPPFFYPDGDDALNYGGIGVVIGHEMTHGFDDEGRQFDAQGNLKDWWTKTDGENFSAHTKVIIDQFNTYFPLDSVHINGELTLGENIADFGGITVAYNAFKKTKESTDNTSLDGFTPDQRFFLSYARVWAGDYKTESMRRQLLTNPHSPGKWRVNGTVTNVPEWYAAWGIKEGDKMYRPESERAKIW